MPFNPGDLLTIDRSYLMAMTDTNGIYRDYQTARLNAILLVEENEEAVTVLLVFNDTHEIKIVQAAKWQF